GDDEPMAEGVAMAAYLVAHGVPAGAVAIEDRATTTEENLLLSREILRSRGLDGDGHLRVVTSSFHVGRSALIARGIGIDADVTGAPAAWHFVPSAFLREFLAAITYRPRTNTAGLALWAFSTALVAYAALPR
ncbi:MAG: YdcF family protein, partial [Terrabacter sp.]